MEGFLYVIFSGVDFFLHLDHYLHLIIGRFGSTTYVILFGIIFAETGLVVTPFLPGDSLLFATGAFAAAGSLDILTVYALLLVAAILGDTVNYAIGKRFGNALIARANGRWIKKEHLEKTHRFYERHGAKTIVFARFVPIVRTFAPFVAGVGGMDYKRFATFNVVGGVAWVTMFIFGGYWFGNIPFVKQNFTLVILAIIAVSFIPGFIEFLRHRRKGISSPT
jgi:membrane-associated protein